MNKKLLFFVLLLFLVIPACGYHFGPGGENIDKSIRKVFVDNFSNLTAEANVENYIRNAFIDQFSKRGRFKLVNSRESSDAFVTGSIDNISTSRLAYANDDMAKEDRVVMRLNVEFRKKESGDIVWSDGNMYGEEAYTVDSSDPAATDSNKRNALKKLSEDTAKRAYRSIMSGF
jgi:hypothetical protein